MGKYQHERKDGKEKANIQIISSTITNSKAIWNSFEEIKGSISSTEILV